jgi:hydrogenase-4 component B
MTGVAEVLPWGALALVVLLPLAVAALWPFSRARGLMVRLAPWAALPALVLSLLPGVEGMGVALPAVATGMGLALDATGLVFLRLTALLWVAAGAFAARYHATDPHRARFFGFFALTMAGNLGLTVAADALTFYLFFAAMTFAAYGLVVHVRSPESQRAGRVYIVLALVGEVLLLGGLMTLGSRAGALGAPGLGFGAELAGTWSEMEAGMRGSGWVAALLVAGFGVKAGLAPLHLWLPLAHPVAPTAASALLSGVMIKAGLLGWLRFLPTHLSLPEVGGALLALGAATALYGVLVGLPQKDPKTVLAYSSVSQMGHLAMGTGILLLEPRAAPAALAAVLLHSMHHGVAKGALFLGVGVGDRVPGLRGPLLAATLVPALALAGAPLTSGFLAKGLLKDALGEVGGTWYAVLDPYLWLASAGTALLLARFGWTWWQRMEEKARPGTSADGPQRDGETGEGRPTPVPPCPGD